MKYPKYLSKYSLLTLQLNDSLFRVTFLTQLLIFLQTLQHPLATNQEQLKLFKLSGDELQQTQQLQQQVLSMLEACSETTNTACLKQAVFESEVSWLKWKASRCPNYEVAPADSSL